MERKYAQYLLEKTYQDYNLIADDYTRTRSFIPEDIKNLGEYAKGGEKILDLGCANGRFFEVLNGKKVEYVGIDKSEKLIEIARKKYPGVKFQVGDAFNLSFPDNYFDKIFSISVFHHMPSEELRQEFLEEAKRVLKPNGLLILRVWDFWRRKGFWKTILKNILMRLAGESKLRFNDVFIPWKNSQGETVAQRYFHCFTKKELENLIMKAKFEIKESWRGGIDPTRTNIYSVAKK